MQMITVVMHESEFYILPHHHQNLQLHLNLSYLLKPLQNLSS